MSKQHLLLGEVAGLLGIRPHRIAYAIASGLIQEPDLRIGHKRVFQPDDVRRLEIHFRSTLVGEGESHE